MKELLALYLLAGVAAVSSVAALILGVLQRERSARVIRDLADVRRALLAVRFSAVASTPLPPAPSTPDDQAETTIVSGLDLRATRREGRP